MKKIYFLLLTLLMSAASFGQVIITELADPNGSGASGSGARFVELYVVGPNAVDFNGWKLVRYTNAGTTLSSNMIDLSSLMTLQPDSYVLIAANGTNFQATYGIAADISAGTGGPADSNGDDKIAIQNNMDVIVDIFGTPGADSNNTNDAMNFEDGRAERVMTVTAPNATWTAAEWNTDNDQGFGDGAQNAPAAYDPGSWIGDATSCGVSLGTATFTCTSSTTGDNNDTVEINIPYTGSDAGITSLTSNTGVVTGDDPATTDGGTITITGQIAEGQAWDLTINGGNCDGTMTSGTVPASECDPVPTVCYDLSNGMEKFEAVAVDTNSDVDVWTETNGVYNMNGFCGGSCAETSNTWLIFGPLDLTGITDLSMTLEAAEGFSGTDLDVQFTADYSSGCPSGATWTSVGMITDSGTFNADFSAATGTAVFIGIQYLDDSGFSDWTLSEVTIGSFIGCPQLGTRPTSNCVVCDISLQSEIINCIANTAGDNNDGVTIDIPYTGVDANITSVTSMTAMVVGSDPSVDMDGTITLANLSEGDAWDLTINGGGCDGTTLSGTVPASNCDPQFLVINEILADPDGDANGDGTTSTTEDEFVEIYNTGSMSIDLTDYTLSDGNSVRHTFAMGTTIEAGDYITVFGGFTPPVVTRANTNVFASTGSLGLNNGGDTVTLANASGNIITSVSYGSEGGNNQSLARNPDFTGPFVQHSTIASNPVDFSPGASNETALSTNNFKTNTFSIYPNPTNTGEVSIDTVNASPIEVTVFDILGKQVKNETISNNRLNISNLKSGVYLLRLTQDNATITKKLVVK